MPVPTKALQLSRAGEQGGTFRRMFFELKNGRVSYIDVPTFMLEVENRFTANKDLLEKQLETRWKVEAHAPVERLSHALHHRTAAAARRRHGHRPGAEHDQTIRVRSDRLGHRADRGQSRRNPGSRLAGNSDFRQNIARLVPQQSVVTFWVYPDSFAMFRQLRDLLYEQDIEVAGRPIPFDHAIAANLQRQRLTRAINTSIPA